MTDGVVNQVAIDVIYASEDPLTPINGVFIDVLRSTSEVAINGGVVRSLFVDVLYKTPVAAPTGNGILLVGL